MEVTLKKENESWHEYLSGINIDSLEAITVSQDILDLRETERKKMRDVFDTCGPYLSESYKSVIERKYPKTIIKEKTRTFPGSNEFPPYSFRFQCQITGDVSKLIKMTSYPKYGILPSDTQNGGEFPNRQDIKNKLEPVIKYRDEQIYAIQNKLEEINKLIDDEYTRFNLSLRDAWFYHYNEYLHSAEWRIKRQDILERDEFACSICESKENLQVHHVTYDNVGKEQHHELLTLCKSCHTKIHEVSWDERQIMEQKGFDRRHFLKW